MAAIRVRSRLLVAFVGLVLQHQWAALDQEVEGIS